ncbi:MAG: hypothetical protein Q7T15_12230 [Microcella sp.]|nr:hypothetical protein [Microcella sp.]MDO8339005.1 hypothetical protein [Microcella sp.]
MARLIARTRDRTSSGASLGLQGAVDPDAHVEGGGALPVAGLLGGLRLLEEGDLARIDDLIGRLHAADTAADPDEGGRALGPLENEVEGDHAAHRAADDHGAVDAEVVEEVGEILAVRVGAWLRARAAEAAEVEADDRVPVGERGNLVVPHAQIGDARVHEDDGGPATAHVVVELGPGDVQVPGRRGIGHGAPLCE